MADSIEWITDHRRFAELAAPWRSLLREGSTPFDTHEWFAAWWAAFGPEGALRVCTAWRGGRLVAVFPLARQSRRELIGMANVHSPVFRPLAADPVALASVLGAVLGSGRRGLAAMAVPAADPSLNTLRAHSRRLGMRVVEEPLHVSPIVETAGDAAEWRRRSKPRWRAPLDRFRRKMARDHDARFTTIAPPHDFGPELARGFEVEASGWKGSQGTAILSSPATEEFYRRVARAFLDRGELRFSSIELDGRLAAFDLTLLHGNRLYLIKTGFDESFRKLAPGLVMRLSVVERCFELGIEAHELLGEDSEWKRKFSTSARAHVTFRAFARGPLGTGHYGYRAVARPLLKRAWDGVREAAAPLRQD